MFHVLYSNVDCITNKMNEIRLLSDLDGLRKDMLIFTEVNAKHILNEYQESEHYVNGFNLYTTNFMKRGFRGIFCYVNLKFSCDIINLGIDFNEYMCIRLNRFFEDVFFLIIYRSPNSSTENNACLLELLKVYLSKKGLKIIIGDFNFPNIDWKFRSSYTAIKSLENKFINFINDNFLYQVVDEPTRCRGFQRQNILDLLLVDNLETISDLKFCSPFGKGDHCVLDFFVNINFVNNNVYNNSVKFNFNKGKYELMNEFIFEHLHFVEPDECGVNYLNGLWDQFVEVLNESILKYIPLVQNKGKKLKVPKHVLNLIKLRNKLWKKYIINRSREIYTNFKRVRNLVKRTISELKQDETLRLAIKIKHNPKVFWQHVNKSRKNVVKLDSLMKIGEYGVKSVLVDDFDKSNHLAQFFKSNYVNENVANVDLVNREPTICQFSMNDLIIDRLDVVKKLGELNKYKSAGPDNIFSRVLVECKNSISSFLCNLFNKSLQLKLIPDDWRYSIITPIYKKKVIKIL